MRINSFGNNIGFGRFEKSTAIDLYTGAKK